MAMAARALYQQQSEVPQDAIRKRYEGRRPLSGSQPLLSREHSNPEKVAVFAGGGAVPHLSPSSWVNKESTLRSLQTTLQTTLPDYGHISEVLMVRPDLASTNTAIAGGTIVVVPEQYQDLANDIAFEFKFSGQAEHDQMAKEILHFLCDPSTEAVTYKIPSYNRSGKGACVRFSITKLQQPGGIIVTHGMASLTYCIGDAATAQALANSPEMDGFLEHIAAREVINKLCPQPGFQPVFGSNPRLTRPTDYKSLYDVKASSITPPAVAQSSSSMEVLAAYTTLQLVNNCTTLLHQLQEEAQPYQQKMADAGRHSCNGGALTVERTEFGSVVQDLMLELRVSDDELPQLRPTIHEMMLGKSHGMTVLVNQPIPSTGKNSAIALTVIKKPATARGKWQVFHGRSTVSTAGPFPKDCKKCIEFLALKEAVDRMTEAM